MHTGRRVFFFFFFFLKCQNAFRSKSHQDGCSGLNPSGVTGFSEHLHKCELHRLEQEEQHARKSWPKPFKASEFKTQYRAAENFLLSPPAPQKHRGLLAKNQTPGGRKRSSFHGTVEKALRPSARAACIRFLYENLQPALPTPMKRVSIVKKAQEKLQALTSWKKVSASLPPGWFTGGGGVAAFKIRLLCGWAVVFPQRKHFLRIFDGRGKKKITVISQVVRRRSSHLLTERASMKHSFYFPCRLYSSPLLLLLLLLLLQMRRSEPESPQREENKTPRNNPCATPPCADLQMCISLLVPLVISASQVFVPPTSPSQIHLVPTGGGETGVKYPPSFFPLPLLLLQGGKYGALCCVHCRLINLDPSLLSYRKTPSLWCVQVTFGREITTQRDL